MTTGDAVELMADGLVTVVEAARLLAVSRSFVFLVMRRGELPYVRIGRVRRVPKRAVLEYAAARLQGAAGGR